MAGGDRAPGSSVPSDPDRIFLLECRLEQLHAALDDARAEADRARTRLAEAAGREADHLRRQTRLQEELASARDEAVTLHRRIEHSEALRAELEGHLREAGARGDADELSRLRREVLQERQRGAVHERSLLHLRARVEELVASRETLLTRVAEWQRVVRHGDHDAIDLAEFIAALRRDILDLEHRNHLGERREAGLREEIERLRSEAGRAGAHAKARAGRTEAEAEAEAEAEDVLPSAAAGVGVSEGGGAEAAAALEGRTGIAGVEAPASEVPSPAPVVEPFRQTAGPAAGTVRGGEGPSGSRADELASALGAAEDPEVQAELLLELGRCGELDASYAIRPWATAKESRVRAAAYEALGRLLEREPSRLEPHVRWGLADADPRVRRRVVLAAATARGLSLRPLLEPLRGDPDAQVRRVVQEVLRRAPPERLDAPASTPPDLGNAPAATGVTS